MKKFLSTLMLVVLVSSASVYADGASSNKTGFKFGGAGFYYYNEAMKGAATLSSVNGGFGWGVFGGYRFNDMLGARVGYHQLANTNNSEGKRGPGYGPDHYFLKAYDAVVSVHVPLSYCTDVAFKVGGAAVNQNVFNLKRTDDPIPEVNFKVTKILPEFGVGMHFQHNRLMATEWVWTRIQGNDNIKTIDLLSFGITLCIPM